MKFCHKDPRPNVSIPTTSRSQYTANVYDQPHKPYAFEVMPPSQTNSEIPNPWPYQPATPDTSMARVRSMVELSGRSELVMSPTTNGNGHLAFPEPQLSRSISHSPTQQFAGTSRHQTSGNNISPTSLGFHRQVSTSSFQSTASSYWEDTVESDSEVRFIRWHIQINLFSLKLSFQLNPDYEDLSCELSKMSCVICHLLVHWSCCLYMLHYLIASSLKKVFAVFNRENCLKMIKSGIDWFPNQPEKH
jgi:hypothetical protein